MHTITLALALSACAAPVPKSNKPPEPTEAQLLAAEKAIKALGGSYAFQPNLDAPPTYEFVLPEKCGDEIVEKLTFLTFRCKVNLRHDSVMTDAGLIAFVKSVPHVEHLECRSDALTAAGVGELDKLKSLTGLILGGAKIDDDCVRILAGLPLETLCLERCPVTAEGAKRLKKLSGLKHLHFSHVRFTGADLGFLKDLPLVDASTDDLTDADALAETLAEIPTLKRVTIWSEDFTDEGAKHLMRLKGLEELDLANTKVTTDGLAGIDKLTELKSLHLGGTTVGDALAPSLVKLPALTWLYVYGTKFTDDGLDTLGDSESLRSLTLTDTGVTEAGIKAYQKRRPMVQVYP